MELLKELAARNLSSKEPLITGRGFRLTSDDLLHNEEVDLNSVRAGEVVALIGDFNARSLATLLRLVDRAAIIVPLTQSTFPEHEYFFEAAEADVVINGLDVQRRKDVAGVNPLLCQLRQSGDPGLILFSSGTTGRPKATLHNFKQFLARYNTPRPARRTLSFLLFDHLGGLNTLFRTLFNGGLSVAPSSRAPQAIGADIAHHRIQVLPTTPTFLRLMLLDGVLEANDLSSLQLVTYGTERMDQPTLDRLCQLLPQVDFRQFYGMSELGVLRVESKARDSLWMRIGGEGVETRIVDGVLQIRSVDRMLGYLNAPTPFDADGWYDTADLVETDGVYFKVVGRVNDVINVGGLKILPSEIERVALLHPDVLRAKAIGLPNLITGQHIEVTCQSRPGVQVDPYTLREHFRSHLPEQFRPHRIRTENLQVTHRFKQA